MKFFSDRWRAFFWKLSFFAYFFASLYVFFVQESDRRSYAMEATRSQRELVELRAMKDRVRQYVLKHLGRVFEEDIFTEDELEYLGKGRISHFGGPNDKTISRYGKTAITKEVGRSLNPNDYYCAYKWDYDKHSPDYLKKCRVLVRYQDKEVVVRVVDWGPKHRLIDVSPATMRALGCETDEKVEAFLIHPEEEQRNS